MGAIYRRKDGRWSTCVSIGGKQRHIYGKTPEEVAAKRDALECVTPLPAAAPSRQLVREYLDSWLEYVVSIRNTASTLTSHRAMIRLHTALAIGHYQLRTLPPEAVQQMLNTMHHAGLSPRTVRYAKAILHRTLNQALKRGYVTRNVAALTDTPRVERYHATALTEAQISAFFVAIRSHRLDPLYWLALLGIRRGELLALSWNTVDLGRGTIRILAGKTRASARTLPLSPTLVRVLRDHWGRQQAERVARGEAWNEHGLVFPSEVGTPLNGRNLLRQFKGMLQRAGLPQSTRFHDLRHTAATLLLEQGMHPKTVQMLLGHSQVSMTMDIYTHVSLEEKKAAVISLEGLFRKLYED